MTESNWQAYCKVHRCWVGPAMPADGKYFLKNSVCRPEHLKCECDCPDETLDIRPTLEEAPWYTRGPREWSPRRKE